VSQLIALLLLFSTHTPIERGGLMHTHTIKREQQETLTKAID